MKSRTARLFAAPFPNMLKEPSTAVRKDVAGSSGMLPSASARNRLFTRFVAPKSARSSAPETYPSTVQSAVRSYRAPIVTPRLSDVAWVREAPRSR